MDHRPAVVERVRAVWLVCLVVLHRAVIRSAVAHSILPAHRIITHLTGRRNRTIRSSKTSYHRSEGNLPATWTPYGHTHTPLPVEGLGHRPAIIRIIIRDTVHRHLQAGTILRIRTNPCTLKRSTSIRIQSHRPQSMT